MLLKHLVGLMKPDAGEIWVDNQNIVGMNERDLAAIREKVGILFQGGALFDSMTVEENIAFPLREAGVRDPKVLRTKVDEMLEVMEMEGEHDKMFQFADFERLVEPGEGVRGEARRLHHKKNASVDMPQEGVGTPVRWPQEGRWGKEERRFCRARWI